MSRLPQKLVNSRRIIPAIATLLILVTMLLSCSPVTPPPSPPSPVAIASPSSPRPRPILTPPPAVPTVDGTTIWQHLQALEGERFSGQGRDLARTYLQNQLERQGWTVTLEPLPNGANVIARSPNGADKPTLLVVAHFDTVPGSPGADDNASGVAAALELARVFRAVDAPVQVAIALFDLEERGLQGSIAFTQNQTNLRSLVGVINLEMVGYTCDAPGCQAYPANLPIANPRDRGDFLAIVGDLEHDFLLQAFQLPDAPANPPLIPVPIPLKGLLTPDVLRSDHAPFWANNIGAVMVTDTANFRNPHYHQPSDTLDSLDRDFLTQGTQRIAFAIATLLHSPALPISLPRDRNTN